MIEYEEIKPEYTPKVEYEAYYSSLETEEEETYEEPMDMNSLEFLIEHYDDPEDKPHDLALSTLRHSKVSGIRYLP